MCPGQPQAQPSEEQPIAEDPTLALGEAETKLQELADLEDYYFGPDKEERKKRAAATAFVCAERATEGSLAEALCAKGRALAFLPGQERQAEELLSKALKLSPRLLTAWNTLGEVYWNQGNYAQAQSSFEQALELCGSNAVSLRSLSMVLRALGGDEEERAKNCAAGLQKAKEATVLDPSDPQNWETLGNAYLGDFAASGSRPDALGKALVAYGRAEGAYEVLGKRNPTLFMNRGMAAKFLEDYNLALRSFETGREIGATAAGEEAQRIVDLLQRLVQLVKTKGGLKTKRLRELQASLAQHQAEASCSLKELRSGEKTARPLAAKVISLVPRGDDIPVVVVCCDANGEFFVLSLYNADPLKIADTLVPFETTIHIQKPHSRTISVKVQGKELSYPSVRVAHPADVAIAGAGNLGAAAGNSVLSSRTEHQSVTGAAVAAKSGA